MMKATVYYTRGIGLEVGTYKANTFSELNEKVERFVDFAKNNEVKVLGYTTRVVIEKVVYSYPSGKTFTKKF